MSKIKVFSAGASGTRFLTDVLRDGWKTASSKAGFAINQRGTTHLPFHRLEEEYINDFQKAIFIYADPRNIFLSICKKDMYRRHRHLIHLGYLGSPKTTNKEIQNSLDSITHKHKPTIPLQCIMRESEIFQRLSIQVGSFPGAENLLIKETESFSGLQAHFDSWLQSDSSIPIAFVKYEHLPEVIDKISNFIDAQEPVKFEIAKIMKQNWKSRTSNYINHECREKLDQLFTPLLNIQKDLPSFWIKEPSA